MKSKKQRRTGGGRKKITQKNPKILKILETFVDTDTRGNPMSPLKYTSKSTRKLAKQLKLQGYKIEYKTVGTLLKKMDYSLQANKKSKEQKSHIDRDTQFRFINQSVIEMFNKNQPAISVDTKKKEIIGEFKNNGKEYCKKEQPVLVNSHDFPDKRLGKVVPYGVYDIGKNKGWVSVGISGDTAEFAVNTIRTWWYKMGQNIYKDATELFITADCGGSNGYRVRLWKKELQKFSNETRLTIHVAHFPPGTSKWNKIEHKMFSYISINWRGKPLVSRETVVKLIGKTTTEKGLEIQAILDENKYKTGIEVSDKEMSLINIEKNDFHPNWNYKIKPQ
ncbi:TPA: ISAzo13 family transposase [Candidatus Magasanikbacteria bacterium]|nr:ISAzo13 family transposase [Candidatus Magasanikbacteria bacterium]